MALSWNEIKDRAIKFSRNWEKEISENAEAKTFWDDFFQIFGLNRRRVASFDYKVTKNERSGGFIDLLWKGQLLVEHKSAGKSLDMAFKQAIDYFPGLKEHELPKYICVCNFQHFKLKDLDEGTEYEFQLNELVKNVQHFAFIAGYTKKTYKDQDPVNIEAAYLMGKLHDELKNSGYEGHQLEMLLVRILFCLFAEDTTIFEKDLFRYFIENKTANDGSDLGSKLEQLFQVLNTEKEKRLKLLDEDFNAFPYVNGKLFEENLIIASFNSKMRETILECSALDWTRISPAIFGSLFQSVKNPDERRNLGAHYTSEKNILKVIQPLFLDELYDEFDKVRGNINKLRVYLQKLSKLRFLDPACGCGNFLVITYRELRQLELKILKLLYKGDIGTQQTTMLDEIIWVNIDQFYGIEIDEWAAKIAEVAMWLIDHQMNMILSQEFGHYYVRLPLNKSANIFHENALKIDWQSLLNRENIYNVTAKHANIFLVKEPEIEYNTVNIKAESYEIHHGNADNKNELIHFDYIYGNPPFIGSKIMTVEQRADVVNEAENIKNSGVLDYVTAWYFKTAKYIQDKNIKVAFVSTNSITQGEQTGILWGQLLKKYGIKIHFAHRTFKWSNEGKGVAAVYCVIIGFANYDTEKKLIFEYENIKGEPQAVPTTNINPYLVNGENIILSKRNNPICNVPKMSFGNIALDSGYLIFTDLEKTEFIAIEPQSEKWFKKLLGATELLYNETRWCLWLKDILPNELRAMPFVLERAKKVKEARLKAKDKGTQKLAGRPYQFRDLNNPENYIAIPITTGENREYIPMVYADDTLVPAVTIQTIPGADLYHFGILSSIMHMTWVKNTCGRLKSDYRYSKDIVYNNLPWPEKPTRNNIDKIKSKSEQILIVRKKYYESSLADLYDPLSMPADLLKAHKELDKAVDLCYRTQPFTSDSSRLEFLFGLYKKYTEGLFDEGTQSKHERK